MLTTHMRAAAERNKMLKFKTATCSLSSAVERKKFLEAMLKKKKEKVPTKK